MSQNCELLPKDQVFHEQVPAREKESRTKCSQQSQHAKHEIFSHEYGPHFICLIRKQIAILAGHKLSRVEIH